MSTGAQSNPQAVAVNPVTNKIYVADYGLTALGSTVTVIDGATNATATVNVGLAPRSLAVNPVTDKIYVAGFNGMYGLSSLTVIDGATNATAAVTVGYGPHSVAVNPITNEIYVANEGGTVTVIDGSTNATTTIQAGTDPWSVAVNPGTNRIYVSNFYSNNVTVINGTGPRQQGTLATELLNGSIVTYYTATDGNLWGILTPYNHSGQISGSGSLAGAPLISPRSSLVTDVNALNGEQETLYLTNVLTIAGMQQHIKHLWSWYGPIDLNQAAPGSTAAAARSSLVPMTDSCASLYFVFYVGSDQLVHLISYDGAWASDLDGLPAASVTVEGSALMGHSNAGRMEVFYFGGDGHVHEIWGWMSCPGSEAFDGWHSVDVTLAAGSAANPVQGSPLVGFVDSTSSVDSLFYVDANQNLQELSLSNSNWSNEIVASNVAGAVAAHENGNTDEVAFIDASGNLQLYTSPSSTANVWSSAGALNTKAGSPGAAAFSSLFTDVLGTTDEYYYVATGSNDIYRLQLLGGQWQAANLIAGSGAPTALP